MCTVDRYFTEESTWESLNQKCKDAIVRKVGTLTHVLVAEYEVVNWICSHGYTIKFHKGNDLMEGWAELKSIKTWE